MSLEPTSEAYRCASRPIGRTRSHRQCPAEAKASSLQVEEVQEPQLGEPGEQPGLLVVWLQQEQRVLELEQRVVLLLLV